MLAFQKDARVRSQILEGILKNLPVLVFRIDQEGRFTQALGSGMKRLGLTPQEVIGVRVLDAFPEVAKDLNNALAGEIVSCESHGVSADGPWWLQNYLFFDDVLGSGTIGFAFDITARKLAEQEREKLELQMQHAQKLESLGVLADGVAHDFNNFLLGILGNVSLALNELSDEHAAHSYLGQIKMAAEGAKGICKSMLDYSGRSTIYRQVFNLSQMVQELTCLLDISTSKHAKLVINIPEQDVYMKGDPPQIQQVLFNFVINASEAIGNREGEITVALGTTKPDAALESGVYLKEHCQAAESVWLSVKDSGCGFDDTATEKIFDPFYSTKFSGRGLGLATVIGIVKSHQGMIDVKSIPGIGTEFRVFFKKEQPALLNEDTRRANQEYRVKRAGEVALVIDDDDISRTIIKEMLRAAGFFAEEVDDGEEGLNLLDQKGEDIDLVVLDVTMPRMSGIDVLNTIRQSRSKLPVLLTSAYNKQEAAQLAEDRDRCTAFLQKPYDVDTFIRAVDSLMTVT